MKIKIRREDKSYCAIATLHELADFSYDDANILAEFYYDDSFEPKSVFVAEFEGQVVGKIEIFKAYKKSRGFYAVLRRLVVKPEYRNKGIASQLLEFAFTEAVQQGCQEVEGNVDALNERLLKLYRRLGLKPIRREIIVCKKLSDE